MLASGDIAVYMCFFFLAAAAIVSGLLMLGNV